MSAIVRLLAPLRAHSHAALASLAAPFLALPPSMGTLRQRIFCAHTTFWIFLFQVLAADKSCAEALRAFLAGLDLPPARLPAPDTGAYCKARARLRQSDLDAIALAQIRQLEASPAGQRRWLGRRVRVIDGTGLSMPDTPSNQAQWPQPKSQRAGCGFPVMRLVVIFGLASGAALAWAKGSLAAAERPLSRLIWDTLAAGDVLLGDRGFCSFAEFVLLLGRGVDSVVRLHGRRDWRVRERLGKNDWLVEWTKSGPCPKTATPEEWAAMPDTLRVRQVAITVDVPGWRSKTVMVATTLLEAKAFPARDLAELYHRRWRAELFLRDLKITLGMDVLRCKTPAMIEKELTMLMAAYNLVRGLLGEAARACAGRWDRLGFKGALSALRQWSARGSGGAGDPSSSLAAWAGLLQCIARGKVPNRPGRSEPRARKRRPKNYPLLTKPRQQFVEIPHRNRYKIC